MISPQFAHVTNSQDFSPRVDSSEHEGIDLADRVILSDSSCNWMRMPGRPLAIGLPAFNPSPARGAAVFHNGRLVRPVQFVGSSDLGVA